MTEFIASPAFLWWALGATMLFVVVAMLWRNISWLARGITPEDMRTQLFGGMPDLLPKSKAARVIIGIVVALAIVACIWLLWGSTKPSAPSAPSISTGWNSPSVGTIADWAGNHWPWIVVFWGIGALAIFIFGAKAKEENKKYASMLQKTLKWVVLAFVVGSQSWVLIRDAFLPKVICPDASTVERSCAVNTAWTYWFKPAPGTPDGLVVCHIGPVESESMVENGYSLYRYRSRAGYAVVQYRAKERCTAPL